MKSTGDDCTESQRLPVSVLKRPLQTLANTPFRKNTRLFPKSGPSQLENYSSAAEVHPHNPHCMPVMTVDDALWGCGKVLSVDRLIITSKSH